MNRRAFVLGPIMGAALACSGVASNPPRASTPAKTLYIVRHAEKLIIEGESDPDLSEAGHARAAALPDALEGLPIDAIYSSPLRRTRQTVAPYAKLRGLQYADYDPNDAAAFAAHLRSAPGLHILIAGHSNTIPSLLEALGAPPSSIEDDQYGDLFVLTLDGQAVHLELRHFGP